MNLHTHTHKLTDKLITLPLPRMYAYRVKIGNCECTIILLYLLLTGHTTCTAVYAFIPDTQSWQHVADLPKPLHSTCSAVLSSNELVLVGGTSGDKISSSVYKASLKGTYSLQVYDPHKYASTLSVQVLVGTYL